VCDVWFGFVCGGLCYCFGVVGLVCGVGGVGFGVCCWLVVCLWVGCLFVFVVCCCFVVVGGFCLCCVLCVFCVWFWVFVFVLLLLGFGVGFGGGVLGLGGGCVWWVVLWFGVLLLLGVCCFWVLVVLVVLLVCLVVSVLV
ncbi:hypothetical protein RA269_27605, partial [Pseudomonas syringae pv. tagetis]|uniref:hypothetical protein n=1 Tax=Pseudomonas syringae group genomosp. 7 TaxID=251699 RepID=UPI00376F8A14